MKLLKLMSGVAVFAIAVSGATNLAMAPRATNA